MPVRTKYEKLVEEEGIEAAREYMRNLRSKVKNVRGLKDASKKRRKEISAMGVKARQNKRVN